MNAYNCLAISFRATPLAAAAAAAARERQEMKNDMVERIALWVLLCFWLAFFCRR